MGGIFCCLDNQTIMSSFIKKEYYNFREEKLLDNKLNQKTKRSIFKIKIKDAVFKKGFFCNIPLKEKGENETMNSIFINDYLINENDNLFGNEIEAHLDNDEKISIQIDNSRKIYIIKNFKISIIEIKKEDKICNDIPFLEIENDIKKDKTNAYLFHFLNNKFNISNCEISNISDNNFNVTCSCNEDSIYQPIINSSNNKIIGILYKNENGQNSNIGILIKYLLNEIEEINFNYLNKKKYIKNILLSFYKIEKLKKIFFQEDINEIDKSKELTNLIAKYMKDYENKNSNNCDKIIIDIEKKIDLKDLKFENLINYILRTLHQEINSKIISNNPPPSDDTDEKISFNNFLKYYNDQNESIIKNLFFGFKEIIKLYKCCYITKYKFEVCEYINLDLNGINKGLQNLMIEWENHQNEEEDKCSICLIDSATSIQYQLYYSSEILIIINNNKSEVELDSIIKTKKFEYKIISCIIESKEPNDFSVIFNCENKWHIIENNNNIEDFNNNKIYPYVLFCEKIKEFNNNESKITFLSEISHNNNKNNNNNANSIKDNNPFALNLSDNTENNNNYNNNIINNNNLNINNNINFNNNINNVNNINNNNMIFSNNNISINNNDTNRVLNNLNNDNKINQIRNMNNQYSINQNNNLINKRKNNSMNMILNNYQILNNKNQIYYSYNQNYNMKNYYNNNFIQNKYNNNFNCNNIIMNSNNNSINNIYSYNNYNINMCPNFMGIPNFQNNNNNKNIKLNSNNNNNIIGDKVIITLIFNIANKKEIFINIENKSIIFSNVITQLKSKYLWLNKINISHFNYNGVKISENKTVKENNLEHNSKIDVVVNNM